jgi:type IV secretion system protein VirB10
MKGGQPAPSEVEGERGTTLVNRGMSLQSRLSRVLALSLMSALGLGSLTWYYAHSMTGQSRARQSAQSASVSRAQGDTALPSIGRIDPPPPPPVPAMDVIVPADVSEDRPASVSPTTLTEIPLGRAPGSGLYAPPPPPTPEQLTQARELSGAVFSNGSTISGGTEPATGAMQGAPTIANGLPSTAPSAGSSEPGELAPLLRAPVAPSVRAQLLPAQRLLLPKGAFIDCTLETAIDSSLPGMTTCILAADTFGVDGKVVLLERGTKLIGETRGQVQQGSARLFVLWTEARTPTGVIVPLASPGTDALGRSGLDGEVDRHFWQRFGAAILISMVDAAAEASQRSGGTVIYDTSSSQGVATEALKGTVGIAPTITKNQGDRIQILVARDLDFRQVYQLRDSETLHQR